MSTTFPNALIAPVNWYQHSYLLGNGIFATKGNSPEQKKATLLLRRFLEDTTSLATVIIGCLLSFRMTSRISSFSKLNDYITREFAQADVDDLPLPIYLGKDKKSPERNPGAHLFRQYKK